MTDNKKTLDCHVHISAQTDVNYLAGFLEGTGTDMANLVACSHSSCLSLVPQALLMKAQYPERFYVYGAPDVSAYYLHPDDLGEYMAHYADILEDMGCDGIKLLEGKPQMRRKYPVPDFDAPVWEPFWARMEDGEFPLLWHVNDPDTFWDASKASAFAISQGWLYDDSYVNNEAQYTQVLNVLERHPQLRVIFAHFFFMYDKLDRLSDILDRYPNVMIDITPGIEIFESLSRHPDEAKAFFKKYGKRICYGTDIGGRCVLMGEGRQFDPLENFRRPQIVREFLSGTKELEIASDGHYLINNPPFIMRPLGLSGEALADIMGGNFIRHTGDIPHAVQAEEVVFECSRMYTLMKNLQGKLPGFTGDNSIMERCMDYFFTCDYKND